MGPGGAWPEQVNSGVYWEVWCVCLHSPPPPAPCSLHLPVGLFPEETGRGGARRARLPAAMTVAQAHKPVQDIFVLCVLFFLFFLNGVFFIEVGWLKLTGNINKNLTACFCGFFFCSKQP